MTDATIEPAIRAILDHEGCGVSSEGWISYRDPVSRASVAIDIEDAFGIADIPEDEAEQCETVSDWAALVGRMVK